MEYGLWGGGGSYGRGHIWLIHIDVWQRLPQHCKAIILQLKIFNKEKKVNYKKNSPCDVHVQSRLTPAESRFLLPASIISAGESLRDSKVEGAAVTSEACASRVLGPIPPSCAPHDLCILPTPCPIPRPQVVGYAFSFSFPSMVSPHSFRKAQLEFSTIYSDS